MNLYIYSLLAHKHWKALERTVNNILNINNKDDREMKREKVYISGAIAHHDIEERKRAFEDAARFLDLKGYEPVNPFDNGVAEDADVREHMRADMALLIGCDYIYMLKGWELSKGAKLELDVASSCGIPVMFELQFNL